MARQGKIARLPAVLRLEVNVKLLNGETSGTILAWLNSQADAVRVFDTHFEGAPCNPQNLSEWRLGGYREWIARRERIENHKELCAYSIGLVEAAGGSIADGAAAMAAGELLVALENVGNLVVTGGKKGDDAADADPTKGLAAITQAVAVMRKGDRDKEASVRKEAELNLRKERHKLNKRQLALAEEKFQRQTVEMLMEYARKPEIQAILSSRDSKTVQMKLLHDKLFGSAPGGKAIDV